MNQSKVGLSREVPAGQGLANIVLDLFLDEIEPKGVGRVGPGNHGSDTLIAITALAESGWGASACLVKRKKEDLVERFTEAGGERLALPAAGQAWTMPGSRTRSGSKPEKCL
jgi:NAD(P)H-hydrate repair Nnr-like enzyme with NAD(P)H-hydrate epimerase domain